MKRSIIFLMTLIVLCALPVLASTPEQDMVLIVDEGDGEFSELEQVSDEELLNIIGNIVNSGTAPDLWQEAGTQEIDEGLILLADFYLMTKSANLFNK